MRKQLLSIATAAAVLSGLAAAPAVAHTYPVDYGYSTRDTDTVEHRRDYRRQDSRRYDRGYNRGYDRRNYGRYDNRRYDNYDYRYNNRNNRYRGYRCDNGTGGTIIGGVVGAIAGHEIAGRRGDQTAGALIGGVVGALGGRAIDRGNNGC